MLSPLAQDSTGVLACHVGQRCHILLAEFADNELIRRARGFAKMLGELKKRARNARLERKEARRRNLFIGLPQSLQKRESGSFSRPQKAQGVTRGPPAGKQAWGANIESGVGGGQ